ncbi:MAG: AAA-like domain-containing protein [Armatimonadetes bacterium]|nr:AAA-like domain-containing protein [Armatimonadota bacterium]
MGIHSGLVQRQIDIAGRGNFVGEGLNTAQRVMAFGEAGHILLSSQYAHWLQQFEEWAPALHPLGEGRAKHDLAIHLFALQAEGAGRREAPAGLSAAGKGAEPAGPPAVARKVALLYKHNLEPDSRILQLLEERLKAEGHEVFADHHLKIHARWAQAIEESLRAAEALIAIVSPKALQSEMLEFEIETAHDQHQKSGKPVILPVTIGIKEEITGPIGAIINPLIQFAWHGPEDDQRLITEILSAIREPLKPRAFEVKLEPVGGAVPPDSPFYVRRSSDQEMSQALERRESILLIRGARQVGKTSLQAQGVKQVKELGWRCALTDFQKLSSSQMASEEVFYKLLAATLARQMRFAYDFESEWLDLFGTNMNLETFLRELLESAEEPLIWFMDEVDKLFGAPFASDFFGLVRSWHNSRSTEPGGCWDKLTVVIAYATEAHLFIQDLNQSPFNVGRRLELEDFNLQQMVDLNGRYGGPLKTYPETEALHGLIGGQPYLARKALDALATGKYDLAGLLDQADWDAGPFGDHLKRTLAAVTRLPEVQSYMKSVLEGTARPNQDAYYRLHAGGVIRQDRSGKIVCRCELYHRYLEKHLQ